MVEIILDKSFIYNFGDINSKEGRTIDKIFLNENNTFIINSSLLEYIEENIDITFLQKWEDYFTYLSDNNKLESSKNDTLDTDVIFKEETKVTDYVIVLKNIDNDLNKNSCNLKSILFNDLLFIELLTSNKITLRNSNFKNNYEIKEFFEKLFFCSKTKYRITIISRYNNFDCDIIKVLKNKFEEKAYWTTKKRDFTDPSTNLKNLRNQLGNKLLVFTGNNEQIHERKLIIGSLIVEFDDDFNKITVDVDTWVCNCLVDKSLADKLRTKQNSLIRVN